MIFAPMTRNEAQEAAGETKNAKRIAALLLTFIMLISLFGCSASSAKTVLAVPQYPKKIAYEDYDSSRERYEEIDVGFLSNLTDFSFGSASLVLANQDSSKNALYSPLSLYMSLAVAAQGAQGETRKELLRALHIRDAQIMDAQTGKLFRRLYLDNEIGRLTLANSLWLNKGFKYKRSFLESAANNCYAHIFSADFTLEETANRIGSWVSHNTGGKLGKNTADFALNPQQVMAILNTVYFYDQWWDQFDPNRTQTGEFTLADGSKVVCDFMNAAYGSHTYVGAEGYTSSALSFKNGLSMVFLLPDEGVSPYEIIADPTIFEQAVNALFSDKVRTGEVVFKIPKFKFNTSFDLRQTLQTLGVKTAFDGARADFSAISLSKPLYISSIKQAAAISIDENGCEASSFTEIFAPGLAPPDGRAELILDRPFVFAITGKAGGAPLFVGVVNNPTA